jgi:hypothetical protein
LLTFRRFFFIGEREEYERRGAWFDDTLFTRQTHLWGKSGVAEYEGAIGVQEHDRGVIYHRLMAEIGFICFGIPWFSQPGGRKKIIWRQWEKRTRIY